MSSAQLGLIAPLDTPLPPLRDGEVLTDTQWRTLMAIADTVVPSIKASTEPSQDHLGLPPSEYTGALKRISARVPSRSGNDLAQQYLSERPSDIPAFKYLISRTLAECLAEDARKAIRVILSALGSVALPIPRTNLY